MVLSAESDFEIITETDPERAINAVKSKPKEFAVAVLDYRMPKDGLTTAKEMLAINPLLMIALLSADQSREVLKKCIATGVRTFIDKDEDGEVIRSIVRGLCQKRAEQEDALLADSSGADFEKNDRIISSVGFTGRSSKLVEVVQMIKRAAKVDCNVFIQGESGTGKELVARAIHAHSPRKNKPFVPINVNAISDNLVESELFGHVKGAFTGAIQSNSGKILSAQGGTLFLDEIGDLKPEIQVKLLRVIQEKRLTPVGSTKEIPFDVRFISATHVDLEGAIEQGRFREDLFYRLHVLPISVPPLRDRPEDVQPLILHFLKIHNGTGVEFLMKTVRLLEAYQWRGNVRELENEIQKLVALGIKKIEPPHLSTKILEAVNYVDNSNIPSHRDFQKKLWEMEHEYIQQNIRVAGSLREACRSIFKSAPSSIHTRITILNDHLTKTKGEGYEQSY